MYPSKRGVFVGESEHPAVRARAPGFFLCAVDQGKLCVRVSISLHIADMKKMKNGYLTPSRDGVVLVDLF